MFMLMRCSILCDMFMLERGVQARELLFNTSPGTFAHASEGHSNQDLVVSFQHEPSCTEVMAVFQSPDNTSPPELQLIDYRQPNKGPLEAGWWDILAFPLLWPSNQKPYDASQKQSRADWAASLFYQQPARLTACPSLAQEYVLTLWNEIEQSRIGGLRAAMCKHRRTFDDPNAHVLETMPASFHGGPAYYKQSVSDTLFTASAMGTANTIFFTFTTNPLSEATAFLGKDRPNVANANWDLSVRDFIDCRAKLRNAIRDGSWLPPELCKHANWYIDALESQMRGLLHAHMLASYGGKEWSVQDLDKIVWAHYPTDEEESYFESLYVRAPS